MMPFIQWSVVIFFLIASRGMLEVDSSCLILKNFKNCQLCTTIGSYEKEDEYTDTSNFTEVKCDASRLERIPDEFLGYDSLSIMNDEIMILPTLGNHATLVKLNLNYDKIHLIQDGAFTNLSKLTHLNLSHNYIIDLHYQTFAGLTNMEFLSLTSNSIYYVEFNAFSSDNVPELQYLYLSQNKIVKVERKSFQGLSKLIELDLSRNRIENLEKFATLDEPLSSLIMLNLGMNKIAQLPEDFFEFMPKLEQLRLEHNFLTSVSIIDFKLLSNSLLILELQGNLILEVNSKCFQEFYKLEKLDLSHNQLKQLKRKALPDKSEGSSDRGEVSLMLLISSNPINCSDCDNSWMASDSLLKKHNHPEEIMCQSPTEVSFGDANENLFQHCYSSASSMKTFSLLMLVLFILILVFLALAFGLCWLRKKRKQHITLNLGGERAGNSNRTVSSPSNKGAFSYRGLEEQFPFSIDEAEENRL